MNTDIWNKALDLLKYDDGINDVVYTSILSQMNVVSYEDNGLLILSCRDGYSKNIVQKSVADNIFEAVKLIDSNITTITYIVEGDNDAIRTSLIAENKVINKTNQTENTGISSEFTFGNFIVGETNKFAHASAVAVANNPGQTQRNPLFFWSNPGLGKTHLMKAIGYSIKQNFPNKNVLYTTCEEFTNAYVACMNNKNFDSFRSKYRSVDVLLIDDIQFLIGKEGTQVEFFYTFESLINAGKQIVITCDKAPKYLTELDTRLSSRFQNGMTMDIQPPDFETRKAIFLSKMKKDGITLTDDIVNYVCENVTSNVRELNGAYNTVSSYYALTNGQLSLEDTVNALSSIISPGASKLLTPEIIIDAVAKYYSLTPDQIKSKLRDKDIKNARAVAAYLCHEMLEMTYKKIGEIFGGRKHTTAMNAIDTVDKDPSLLDDVKKIKSRITE